jgi:CubicO group peptidase (beta-lactamase class C family)
MISRMLLLLVAAGLVQSCSDPAAIVPEDTVTPYWPDSSWRTASPEAVGMNGGAFAGALHDLRGGAVPGITGFVVVRHGYVIAEEYFAGHSATALHTMQSVTKSVTSLAVGIARDSGYLATIDTPVVDMFPQYAALANMDANKRALRVRDLLTMRSGMSFWEQPYAGSPLEQLNSCGGCDWAKLVLDRPMSGAPDQSWSYNSGGVIVLGGVLRRATGEISIGFIRRTLFEPIGITQSLFVYSPFDTLPHLGGGLRLRTIDVARIGYLVLKNGRWGDRQVISEQWLATSTARVTANTPQYFPRATDYGMLWWLFPRNGSTGAASANDYIVTGAGTGGQWLFIDRANQLVVVFNGTVSSSMGPGVDFFFNRVLPAVR